MAKKPSAPKKLLRTEVALGDAADIAPPIRLLIVADNLGATQQISFMEPLKAWRQAGAAAVRLIDEQTLHSVNSRGLGEVRAFLEAEFECFQPTILIFSRYSGSDYAVIFEIAERCQIPVVYHLDDDLFEVPISLGIDIYRRYRQPNRVHAMYRIAEAADAVFVSTPALAKRVTERVRPKRLIQANVYVGADLAAAGTRTDDKRAGEVRIGYMASAGHALDLELAEAGVKSILMSFPQVTFHLFGSVATTSVAKDFGDRAVRQNRVVGSYQEFKQVLHSMSWDIGLAPLCDHEFNACKAPTKWLEYAEAGIATIASDHPVYRPLAREGALMLSEDSGWESALAALVTQAERRRELVGRAGAVLARDYSWSRVEDQVIDLIAALDLPAQALV